MKKYVFITVIHIMILVLLLAGCSGKDPEDSQTVLPGPTAEHIAAATWEAADIVLQKAVKMMGSTLYYIEGEWDTEKERYHNTTIYRKQKDHAGKKIADLQGKEFLSYLVDEEEALYRFYEATVESLASSTVDFGADDAAIGNHNSDGTIYYLQKTDAAGSSVYNIPVSLPEGADGPDAMAGMQNVIMGEVSRNGEVCLSNADGDLYVFSAEGHLLSTGRAGWNRDTYHITSCGLVNAGQAGIYTYIIKDREVLLRKINLPDGTLEPEISVPADSPGSAPDIPADNGDSAASLRIFNGYDMGVLLSDEDALWKYDISGGALTKICNWSDSTVNLKGYIIDAIGTLPQESLYIMAHRSYEDVVFVQIDQRKQSELPAKQRITLSVMEGQEIIRNELEKMANAFHLKSPDYEIILEPYSSVTDFQAELAAGKGPDIIYLGSVEVSVLASKGVLENLTPYFAESNVIRETELLPAIRRAGTIGGQLLCVIPTFQADGMLVEKGAARESGWTAEDYIAMGERYPEAMLVRSAPASYHSQILMTAIQADLERYIDWQEKKCYFDTSQFISLLNSIRALKAPNNAASAIADPVEDREKFYQKEILTYPFIISSLESLMSDGTGSLIENGYAEITGYPNQAGEPYFILNTLTPMGINSASGQKDGAWAFLEFLLSEEYQRTRNTFPVRQDAFNTYLESDTIYGFIQTDITDEDRELIRFMIDHAYWTQKSRAGGISYIIYEETAGVWKGEKTAEKAAEIIQNRVSLFLEENN